jgi:hypothetical protein
MCSFASNSSARPLFLTPKAATAIPVADALAHDALRQAALDPAVSRIEYVGAVAFGRQRYDLDGILIVRDGARLVLDFQDDRRLRTLDEEGLRLIAVETIGAATLLAAKEDVLAHPRCANARRVWAARDHCVTLGIRNKILAHLDEEGGLTIRALGPRYKDDVFALACEAVLDIDISADSIEQAAVRPSGHGPLVRRQAIFG